MSSIEVSTVAKLLDPLHPRMRDAVAHFARQHPVEFFEPTGWLFDVHLFTDGVFKIVPPDLVPEVGRTSIYVWFHSTPFVYVADTHVGYDDISLRVQIHTSLLLARPAKYSIYSIAFDTPNEDASFDQIRAGYIGITKRSPFARFQEHRKKVETRSGSVLHKAWAALIDGKVEHYPILQVFDCAQQSLEDAYAHEERLVADLTLAPRGLNAIPGGMAGIKMMHELRFLKGTTQIMPEDRDRAIENLSRTDWRSPKAHFRTGHVRRLPSGQNTWVRSCWVNLNDAEMAV